MGTGHYNFYQNLLMLVVCCCLFSYVSVRAYNLSMTCDESLSVLITEGNPVSESTANHHILNTYLMKLSSAFFGDSEWAFRLPNVVMFLLYLLACFQLLKTSENTWLTGLGASLLLFNPFVLDFFSLARGYGISLGFMMASVYFLLAGERRTYSFWPFMKDFFLALAFATLALFANLGMINYFIACLAIFSLYYLMLALNHPGFTWKNHVVFSGVVLIAFIPLILAINRLLFLKNINELYFGAKSLNDTLLSLIVSSFTNVMDVNYIRYFIFGLLLLGVFFILVKRIFDGPLFKTTLLLALLILGSLLEHYLFDALYPLQRTAIYFIPLFALFIYFLATHFIHYLPGKLQYYAAIAVCCIFAIPLLLNFGEKLNLKYTYAWKYDAHTKDVAKIIEEITHESTQKDGKYSISNNWTFMPALNYYIHSRKLNFELANREENHTGADFLYLYTNEYDPSGYKVLATYPDIGTSLYQKVEDGQK